MPDDIAETVAVIKDRVSNVRELVSGLVERVDGVDLRCQRDNVRLAALTDDDHRAIRRMARAEAIDVIKTSDKDAEAALVRLVDERIKISNEKRGWNAPTIIALILSALAIIAEIILRAGTR